MKKILLKRKLLTYGIITMLLSLPYSSFSQGVKRQCISSYGSSVLVDNVLICQTVGQSFATASYSENNTAVLHGFQQPFVYNFKNLNAETNKFLSLIVYPNPATFIVTIESKEKIENPVVQVTDLTGKLIVSDLVASFLSHSIDCSHWENGTYIITVCDKNQNKSSHKLIISK
ncbi:MAG: T9SS type A sorting domain-containing protein [Bacteroidota bacterium]